MTSNSRESMTASMLPQPSSLYAIQYQSDVLQKRLQTLLDAQGEGLLAGRGDSGNDGISSNGSSPSNARASPSAPSSHARRRQKVMPVRQPKPKRIGLRGARRGISRAIDELAGLKADELDILSQDIAEREAVAARVVSMTGTMTGLQRQIAEIKSGLSSSRLKELQTAEHQQKDEIHKLELQIYELKARHRHTLREIEGLENGVQSTLSSYQNALELAERDAKDFLRHPPLQQELGTQTKSAFRVLPSQRRTLDMAEEQYMGEIRSLNDRLGEIQAELDALQDGAEVWDGVLDEVASLEEMLEREMKLTRQARASDEDNDNARNDILGEMHRVKQQLEGHLQRAEKQEWRLLVCCIGAELNALSEGLAVMEGGIDTTSSQTRTNATGQIDQPLVDDSNGKAEDSYAPRSEDEDDGPGPDLLISHIEEP